MSNYNDYQQDDTVVEPSMGFGWGVACTLMFEAIIYCILKALEWI